MSFWISVLIWPRFKERRHACRRRFSNGIRIFTLISLNYFAGCGISPPPNVKPQEANIVSLNSQDWHIFYSAGMPSHPSADPAGAWSFKFPDGDGHVNYIQTPFRVTETPHSIRITFKVESDSAQYKVIDSNDTLPATIHMFFEQQNDDLRELDGRWWSFDSGYNLGSQDNDTITLVVPLTPDKWANVHGQHDSNAFYAALNNVGWIGVTCGGRSFFGHGVAVSGGHAKYILVGLSVD